MSLLARDSIQEIVFNHVDRTGAEAPQVVGFSRYRFQGNTTSDHVPETGSHIPIGNFQRHDISPENMLAIQRSAADVVAARQSIDLRVTSAGVIVVDQYVWGVDHLESALEDPVEKIGILGNYTFFCPRAKKRVESSYGIEHIFSDRHIAANNLGAYQYLTRRYDNCPLLARENGARLVITIVKLHASPDRGNGRVGCEFIHYSEEPMRIGYTVIVSENKYVAFRLSNRGIQGIRLSLPTFKYVPKMCRIIPGKGFGEAFRAVFGIVIDDHSLPFRTLRST